MDSSSPLMKATRETAPSSQMLSNTSSYVETFGIDEVFLDYSPPFNSSIETPEIVLPKPFEPLKTLNGTVAANVFSNFCQEKFGFVPKLDKM